MVLDSTLCEENDGKQTQRFYLSTMEKISETPRCDKKLVEVPCGQGLN